MKLVPFFMMAVSLLFSGCDAGHQHGSASAIQLNNGKRWEANPETTQGIADMSALVSQYLESSKAPSDRMALKESLEQEFRTIFKNCTMTGEAHNQLHNYLLPMKALFKDIGSDSAEDSDAAIAELHQWLSEYKNYFQ